MLNLDVFTQSVVDAMGPNTQPRQKEVLSALIKHLHAFAREVDLTIEEWFEGMKFVNSIGQIYKPTRNECHRISDVLGLETLLDEMAHMRFLEGKIQPTSSSILGPFWSAKAPFRENGGTIIMSPHKGEVTLMHGRVMDSDTKQPIANAVFDIWQASSNGKYDFQDEEQADNNLRGKFKTNEKGEYYFYCLKPTAYSLPTEGPAWVLLSAMDRSPWRPAHMHIMVSHPDYNTVVTQLYPREDPHLKDDSVFAVKDDLVVDFKPLEGDAKAKLELTYDTYLSPKK